MFVWLCGKSGQPFVVDVEPQWVTPCKQNVYPKVKLKFVNQQWVLEIPLNYIGAAGQLLDTFGQEDPFALAGGLGLDYKYAVFALFQIVNV